MTGLDRRARFATTRWTVVLRAGNSDEASSREALEQLCRQYWFPLYAFVRRKGHSPEDAADLTQDFFTKLLQNGFPAGAEPGKGRFRTFLLTSLSRFLINDWIKSRRVKRGSGERHLSIEALIEESGEVSYLAEVAHGETPEELYQRTWAETLLKKVFHRLEQECLDRGDARFDVLRSFLDPGQDDAPRLQDAAGRLGLTVPAFKSLLHRFRQRYRALLLEEVGQTVDSLDDVQEEMRGIIRALRS
jgi:RNA polymerase sigma factor (sigma-70 family)